MLHFGRQKPGGLGFYWWTPDPTFVELAPLPLEFPPYNSREFAQGIQTSSPSAMSINTIVSQDLGILAPVVEQFADKLQLTLDQMDAMLWDQKNTGDTWGAVACRWIQANRATWQRWIPSESACFPGFGLFDPILNRFSSQRVNVTNKISCQALRGHESKNCSRRFVPSCRMQRPTVTLDNMMFEMFFVQGGCCVLQIESSAGV